RSYPGGRLARSRAQPLDIQAPAAPAKRNGRGGKIRRGVVGREALGRLLGAAAASPILSEESRRRGTLIQPPNVVEEVGALDQLHREKPLAAVRQQLIKRHEVGMNDVRKGAELPLQSVESLVARRAAQRF